MNKIDLRDRRHQNLMRLIGEKFAGKQAEFALVVRKNATQVNHWVSGHRNPNGDTCRDVERALGYPEGWLDKDHSYEISPTLAAQLPPPAENLPISGQKQPLAGEYIASGAIDINTNRRGPMDPQSVVAALGALLAGVEPTRAASVQGLLADFARSPGDAWVAEMLTKALEPATFAQPSQRTGS